MSSDSDSDFEIPLCDAAAPSKKKRKIDVSALKTSDDSLELHTAQRETEEARKAAELKAKADAERRRRDEEARAAAEARLRVAAEEATAPQSSSATAGTKYVNTKRKPADETTRAKNKRKEKLGQAKFTLKEDRDCPSVWDGGGK